MSYDYINDYEFLVMSLCTKMSFYIVEKRKTQKIPNNELNEFEILNCLIEAINDLQATTVKVCNGDKDKVVEHMKGYKDAQSILHGKLLSVMSTRDVIDFSELKRILIPRSK